MYGWRSGVKFIAKETREDGGEYVELNVTLIEHWDGGDTQVIIR